MTRAGTAACTAIAAVGVFAVGAAFSARQQEDQAPPDPERMRQMMEGMERWLASMEPSQHHAVLEPLVGSWRTTTKIWWAGPEGDPITTEGTSEIRWTLGKRFLLEEHEGRTILPDPQNPAETKTVPYQGIGLTGYNNLRNVYESTWANTADTHISYMTGTYDPTQKVLRFYGEMDEPMAGRVGQAIKFEVQIVSNDKHVLSIYDLPAGENYKVVEITYDRKP